eukprot:1162020-Pelagomonas_calceolata.AAC.17
MGVWVYGSFYARMNHTIGLLWRVHAPEPSFRFLKSVEALCSKRLFCPRTHSLSLHVYNSCAQVSFVLVVPMAGNP